MIELPRAGSFPEAHELDYYVADIERLNAGGLLDEAQEIELAKRKDAGDRAAFDALVEHNVRLVIFIAKHFTGRGVAMLDLVQAGNIGLMHGIEKFDHTKGFRISTYVTWWIRQAVQRSIAKDGRTIRVPQHIYDELRDLQSHLRRMPDPTVDELAGAMGVSCEKAEQLLIVADDATSLDEALEARESDDDLDAYFADTVIGNPVDETVDAMCTADIEALLDRLDKRSRDILARRFGLLDHEPHTRSEIGAIYGVSGQAIAQTEGKLLKRLAEQWPQLREYIAA